MGDFRLHDVVGKRKQDNAARPMFLLLAERTHRPNLFLGKLLEPEGAAHPEGLNIAFVGKEVGVCVRLDVGGNRHRLLYERMWPECIAAVLEKDPVFGD